MKIYVQHFQFEFTYLFLNRVILETRCTRKKSIHKENTNTPTFWIWNVINRKELTIGKRRCCLAFFIFLNIFLNFFLRLGFWTYLNILATLIKNIINIMLLMLEKIITLYGCVLKINNYPKVEFFAFLLLFVLIALKSLFFNVH